MCAASLVSTLVAAAVVQCKPSTVFQPLALVSASAVLVALRLGRSTPDRSALALTTPYPEQKIAIVRRCARVASPAHGDFSLLVQQKANPGGGVSLFARNQKTLLRPVYPYIRKSSFWECSWTNQALRTHLVWSSNVHTLISVHKNL